MLLVRYRSLIDSLSRTITVDISMLLFPLLPFNSEIDHVMQAGKKNRSVGATLMNQTSSRSHSIFTIVVECAESDERVDHIRVGKLNLVDLAGSERQGKVRHSITL